MHGMTHRWSMPQDAAGHNPLAPPPSPPHPATPAVSTRANPLVQRFLHARGLHQPEEVERFASPRLSALHSPALLPDLDRAAARLLHALAAREPIVIYGDYDADGICASAILFHILQHLVPLTSPPVSAPRLSPLITTYVPHRIDEGYGLNETAIRKLAADGARVIVTVDCGITALGPARAARECGTDLIITDHHLGRGDGALPDVYALVHPRRPDSTYPFGELCGAGVAFKLAWRLATMHAGSDRVPESTRTLLLDLLALASLGTIADIVPLVEENRVIARFGLSRVRSTALVGLGELVRASGLAGAEITSEHAGFLLAPRLNACGRLEHASDAVELLTTADEPRSAEIAKKLSRLNDERRRTEQRIFEEAAARAEAEGMTHDDHRAIVLADPAWHPGVVGIVCSRLVSKYHRPTILLNEHEGRLHGSGRSIDGFNLHAAIAQSAHLLERFGGHEMAAGLALSRDNLAAFTHAFTGFANRQLAVESLTPELRVDCEASVNEMTDAAVRQLLGLGPFGRGNPWPRFLLRDLVLPRAPERFGAGGDHLSVFVRQGARELRLVGWRWGARRDAIHSGQRVDAVVEPKLSVWQGRARVEPEVRDLRLHPAGA